MYRVTVVNGRSASSLQIVSTPELCMALKLADTDACDANEQPSLSSSCTQPSVPFQVGSVRLLRNIAYKGQFLVPFLPTKHLLLVFPNSIDCRQRDCFAPLALDKMSCFLSYLKVASGVAFTVDAVDLCDTSGAAVLILSCTTTEDTLEVLAASERVAAQTEKMRMSSVYIRCYPVEVSVPSVIATSVSSGEEPPDDAARLEALFRNHYYSIPLCLICADRLELNLTGVAEEQPLCACGNVSCHCLHSSSCVVCHSLYESQLGNSDATAGANGSNNNSNNSGTGSPRGRALACEDCGQSSDPWVCLICGYVGCSRYQAMHAKDHYVACHHFFSINVTTQQVWDYESDNFVHRVVMQPEANGGMRRVQYESRENPYASGELDEDALGISVADPGLSKKCVSAKYDLKLSGSHAQYATILKNELDSMRQLLQSQLTANGSGNGTTTVAAARSVSSLPTSLTSVGAPPVVSSTDDDPYAVMDAQVDTIVSTYRRQSSAVVSAFLSLQHMEHELRTRKAEAGHLEEETAALEQTVRDAIRRNIITTAKLDTAITEQKDLLKDLELNRRVSANLSSRLQSGDGLARVVTVDGSGTTKGGKKKNTDHSSTQAEDAKRR